MRGEGARQSPAEPGGSRGAPAPVPSPAPLTFTRGNEWGRLAQVRTASAEVSRSESINTKINVSKKKKKILKMK